MIKRFGKKRLGGFRKKTLRRALLPSPYSSRRLVSSAMRPAYFKTTITDFVEEKYTFNISTLFEKYYYPKQLTSIGLQTRAGNTQLRLPPGLGALLRIYPHARFESVAISAEYSLCLPSQVQTQSSASSLPAGPINVYDGIIPASYLGVNTRNTSTDSLVLPLYEGAINALKRTAQLTNNGSQHHGAKSFHKIRFRDCYGSQDLPQCYSIQASQILDPTDPNNQALVLRTVTGHDPLFNYSRPNDPVFARIFEIASMGDYFQGTAPAGTVETTNVPVLIRTKYQWTVVFSGQQAQLPEWTQWINGTVYETPNA